MRLNGIRAIVTGGGSGLGRAIVDRFIAEGASVVVLDMSAPRLATLCEDHPGRVHAVEGDVRDLHAHQQAVQCALDELGGLDLVVPNAGIWDYNRPLSRLPDDAIGDAFDEIMGVNVKGGLFAAKAALPALVESGGSMIFTVSSAGFFPDGGGTLYTASKHALVGLVRQLAFEAAPHVRVNGVAPGVIQSELRGPAALAMENRSISDVLTADGLAGTVPIDRLATPTDYTSAYVFLAAANESGQATGSIINIDGGYHARGVGRARGGDNLRSSQGTSD